MKLPLKNSRARTILEALCAGPVTVHQGIEHHGDLGFGVEQVRRLYINLELADCCSREGMVFTITDRALAALRPPAPPAEVVDAPVTPPAYRGNWQASTLSAASARRAGGAFGYSRDVIEQVRT